MALKINDLAEFRYSITKPDNAIRFVLAPIMAYSMPMAATYENLIEIHLKRLTEQSKSRSLEQVKRNHMTAIRAFLQTLKKSITSPVGAELTGEFDTQVAEHLKNANLSSRSSSDRRSLLMAWKTTYELMNVAAELEPVGRERNRVVPQTCPMQPFEVALKDALTKAKLTPRSAARLAQVSASALGRWSRGAIPNIRALPSIAKIEAVLNLPANTLANLRKISAEEIKTSTTIESRQRAAIHTKISFRYKKCDISPELLRDWGDYFDYKTSVVPRQLKRRAKARWMLTAAKDSSVIPGFANSKGGMVSASANFAWNFVSAYLGFLCLEKNLGGVGLDKKEVQTLAWLAVPETVERYLDFMCERSDGLKHGGHRTFCASMAAITDPGYGYLTQRDDYLSRLSPEILRGRTWSDLCQETFEMVKAWKRDSNDMSREPTEPLQYFFQLTEPLVPIFDVMRKLREEGDAAPRGSIDEAIARRDELILGLIISNPLRAKNIMTMTYKSDESGGIYRTHNGLWRIRIKGSHFKNSSRVAAQKYDVPVAGWLKNLLDEYIRYFRPVLVGNNIDLEYLFVSSRGGKRFDSMSRHIFKVIKRYLPKSGGIALHAFRHLVTTDWLTKNPNDFVTIAELLNDTIEVVMKNYAHLKKETSFVRYEEYLKKVLPSRFM